MLTFLYPWLFLLLPFPWLLGKFLPRETDRAAALRVPFLGRLEAAAQGSGIPSTARTWKRWFVPCLLWLALLTALARPQWLEPPITRDIPTRDLLLLIDLSKSMEKEDFTNAEGKTVDRLTAVKEVVENFLTHREGDRVGLVVFGSAPFLQVPFTTDLELCRQLLDQTAVGMAGPKTALGDAIGLGIQTFEASDGPAKTMIVLTDGNDTASGLPPVEAARVARDRAITLHTIAIGDPTTVGEEKLDLDALRGMAETTGGKSFFAQDRQELAGIYDELDRIEQRKVETVSYRPRRDLYHWPLAAALLLSWMAPVRMLLRRKSAASPEAGMIRVNTRTFELELVPESHPGFSARRQANRLSRENPDTPV